MGSGFVISGNGLVITNYHVIRGKEKIEVYFPSIDKKHILKVGKITDKTIPYVSDDYRVYFTDEVNKHLEGWKLNEL